MKISISDDITYFNTTEVGTVEEMGKLACEWNISTSVFTDGHRRIANFERADVIGIDIDNDGKKGTPLISVSDAKKIFGGFKHVLLATRNHNVEKNGIVAERFRIILFLDTPIVRAEDFYATWYYLKSEFPWIDIQCKDPSRLWYKHKEVLGFNDKGILITPIRYTEPEKPLKEGRPVLPGEHGELSKETLKFLEFGVTPGSRNGTVYKVAREFLQALFDYDEAEARILSALHRNNVLASDFPESEAKHAIRSAYSKDSKHAPRLSEVKTRAFNYQSLGEVLSIPDIKEDALVEGVLYKGGLSLIVGGPKVGKTTLVRQLEKSVLRGEEFLGRQTTKGIVFHYSFDEKAKTAKRHYEKLGLTKDDPMSLHFGIAHTTNYRRDLEEDLMKFRPALVVIDTLFDMVNVEDVNSYAPIKKELTFFSSLAEKAGVHIMFIHHQNKPNANYSSGSGHSILGSTAIFGAVDCCFIFEEAPNSKFRTLVAKGRAVDDFKKLYLSFNKLTMTYEVQSGPEEINY